jgi:peptide/nickel transport system substrate-binding protein
LSKAVQILTAAGWRDRNGNGTVDKNGVEAEFTLLYMANTPHEQGFALAVAQMLEPMGIKIKLEGSNWEKMQYRTGSDAWLYTLVTRPQDLLSLYRSTNATGRPNYSHYTNFVVDKILDRGMQARSETEASYYWQRSHWNGKTGIGTQGDAASVWLAKLDETFLASDCLDLGRFKVRSQHHRGSLLATITEWKWTCK